MLDKAQCQSLIYRHLALLAAVLLEAHIRFLSLSLQRADDYCYLMLQQLIVSVPLFVGHELANHPVRFRALLGWGAGFLAYPVILMAAGSESTAPWLAFSGEGWLFAVFASVAWFLHCGLTVRKKNRTMRFISVIFSLNIVIASLLLIWALIVAGIFTSHDLPMHNQPLNAVVDIGRVVNSFGQFMNYLWQFCIMAAGVGGVYLFNRYILIRQILARRGMLAFTAAALVWLIVATPLLASLVLSLPINIATYTLLPSEDHLIFSAENYQFMFLLLAISTPLILAFEKQQQATSLATISEQQTQTELKMLQQQINPHFLFNALNSLYALTLKKSDDAPNLVMQLSNLLRYTVYDGQKSQVSLAQELAYLQNYIALQKIRNGDRCNLDLVWPISDNNQTIAPLLLIIVLENAFKYGVEPTIESTQVSFHVTLVNNTLTLHCKNKVFASQDTAAGGLGLDNLRRRLTLLYPDKHQFSSQIEGEYWCTNLVLELTPC